MKCKLTSGETLIVSEYTTENEIGKLVRVPIITVDGRLCEPQYALNRLSPLRKQAFEKLLTEIENHNK